MSLPTVVVIVSIASMVSGHGRVMEPVSRASAWRKGFDTPKNYDDDGLNCGGMSQQWSANGGRCGICGDAYDLPTPRPHEIGGKYGEGVIVRAYNPGSIITTAVQLTASHRGFWEFKICPDPEENDQRCFNKYPLELEDGGTKFYPTEGAKLYEVNFRLPQGLTCEHCVLQWRYTAGNNWGDCMNGTQGMGCGHQEQFGACSDIVIGNGARPNQQRPQQNPTGPQKPFYIPIIPPQPRPTKPQNHPNQIHPQTRPQHPIPTSRPQDHKNPSQNIPQIRPQSNPNQFHNTPSYNPSYFPKKPYDQSPSRPSQKPSSPQRPPHPPRRPKPLPPGLRNFLRQNSANALKFQKGKRNQSSKKQRINSKKPKTKIPTYLHGAIKLYPAIKTYYQKYPELFNPYFYGF